MMLYIQISFYLSTAHHPGCTIGAPLHPRCGTDSKMDILDPNVVDFNIIDLNSEDDFWVPTGMIPYA